MPRQVTAFSNSTVKRLRSLRDKKARREEGLFLAEGLRILTEARDSGRLPEIVAFSAEGARHPLAAEIIAATEAAGGEAIETTPDILSKMSFTPLLSGAPRLMDERIFRAGPMGLREDLLQLPIEQRLAYDPKQDLFFVNLSGFSINSRAQIDQLRSAIDELLAPLGRRVPAIVNYEGFSIGPDLIDAYTEMVRGLMNHRYSHVTRYSTNGFLRLKLGEALADRGVAPHIYESSDEARTHLGRIEDGAVSALPGALAATR